MLESSLGDLRRLGKDGGEAKKGLGKAQYSYIKEKGVKGVSFLCTYTAETVSHLNILGKAISERKEKKRTTAGRSPNVNRKNGNWRFTYKNR
jgi:hypothetical protein